MFAIKYLSTENRRLIETLEQKLLYTKDPDDIALIRAKIEELQATAKNYLDCNIEEANDLKSYLFEKLLRLGSIGKHDGVAQFRMLIEQVELHIETLMLKSAMREQARAQQPKPTIEDLDIRRTPIDRPNMDNMPNRPEKKTGRDKWSIGGGRIEPSRPNIPPQQNRTEGTSGTQQRVRPRLRTVED